MKTPSRMPARWLPSLAMAVIAVLALAATVFVAQGALRDASSTVVRGEADVLLGKVGSDLAFDLQGKTPTSAVLATELASYTPSGLRYIAVYDEGGKLAEAGTAVLPDRPPSRVAGMHRVRIAGPLGPTRHGGPFPPAFGAGGGHAHMMLVLELEPPTLRTLWNDLMHIAIVATVAGAILLAFAIAWARGASRLAAIEERAARQERLVALGSMSSVMAHELRNPLASLKGHAQLLLEDLDDPKQRTRAERVVVDAERLEVLTSSLLDFVRDGPIERQAVTSAELVARSLEDLPSERVQVDASPTTMAADVARLARAVHNLVDNALQADAGTVDLTISRDGSMAEIAVRDRGPGIDPAATERIFEPFHTTRTRGTGLGLAVARRIAEQHGGTLVATNHPDGGACFRLRFPTA